MNKRVRHSILTLAAAAVLLGAFATAGVYNVSARVGHWPVTAWFLHFMMRQSARTHALGIETPPLDDPRMAVRGATYFAVGCAICHGEPGSHFTPIVHYTTPEAPRLAPLIETWDMHELYWIIDNGIKYTGMPAWATPDRPDEVWSMVAFLKRLPGLDPTEYRKLAFQPGTGESIPPSIMNIQVDEKLTGTLDQCVRCHGYDGMGRSTGAFPYLGGQKQEYLFRSLKAFADGERASGFMQPIAAGLDERTMRSLARHYAGAAATVPNDPPHEGPVTGDVERGAEIATLGIPARDVPACIHCHGPGPVADHPVFPRIEGQHYEYLVTQLELWREGTRGGTDFAPVMAAVAGQLDDAEIRDVAAFYSSLPWSPEAP